MNGLVDKKFITYAVERYSDTVLRIAFQHTKNRTDAEDVMQEVFLALVKRQQFDNPEHLKAWLIRVTINKSRDYLRVVKRRKESPLDTMNQKTPYSFEKKDIDIAKAVFSLPKIDRDIIHLYYFERYTAAEIAEILKKRENTVHARLKRAREKLEKLLGPDFEQM